MVTSLPYRFIDQLKALPFVDAVYLFGSRARGDQRSRSDIDIAVKLKDNSANHWHEVIDVIENADTLLEIDCVNLDEANEKLRQRILSQGQLL